MDKLVRIAKGYAIGLVIFFLLSAAGALILKFTPFKEEWGFAYLLIALGIACLFIGIYMGSFFQKGGIFCGLVFSAVFVLLVIILVCLSFSTFISASMLSPLYLIPVGAGIVGGVAGTNITK